MWFPTYRCQAMYTILPQPLNSSRYFRRQHRYIRIGYEWTEKKKKIRTRVDYYRGRTFARALRLIPVRRFPRAAPARGKSARCAIGNRHEYLIYRRTRKRDERRTSCSEDFVSPFTWSSPRGTSWAHGSCRHGRPRSSFWCFKEIYISLPRPWVWEKTACQDIHPLPPLWLKKKYLFPRIRLQTCVENFPALKCSSDF